MSSARTRSAALVSVIIPARNAAAPLSRALSALLAGTYPLERLEVIVADGASSDRTRAVVDAWGLRSGRAVVRRVDNPARSTPAGLNAALRAASGEVIVRLDAHAVPAADYVECCVAALRATGAAAVGGAFRPTGEAGFARAAAAALASPFGGGPAAFRHGGAGAVDTVYLGAWRRETLVAAGGFDEEMPTNQDYELCARLRAAGGVVWLDPAIVTATQVRDSPVSLARQYFFYGAGRAGTAWRHPWTLQARQLAPAALGAAAAGLGVGALVPGPARRWLRRAAAGYAALALGAARLATRPGEPRLTLSVAAVFPVVHLSWAAGFWLGLARLATRRLRR